MGVQGGVCLPLAVSGGPGRVLLACPSSWKLRNGPYSLFQLLGVQGGFCLPLPLSWGLGRVLLASPISGGSGRVLPSSLSLGGPGRILPASSTSGRPWRVLPAFPRSGDTGRVFLASPSFGKLRKGPYCLFQLLGVQGGSFRSFSVPRGALLHNSGVSREGCT